MDECKKQQWQNLWTGAVSVEKNEPLSADTFKITLAAPHLAPLVGAGQFVMLRLANVSDPLLGRPLAVYSACEKTGLVELIYQVVGKMTRRLACVTAGETLELTGPLGNGWSVIEGGRTISDGKDLPFERLVMVAGGVGQAPFYLLAKKYAELSNRPRMTLLYGARTRNRLAPLSDFEKLGVETLVATEDGSVGVRGYVTDLLASVCDERTMAAACGPKPMLAAVFRAASAIKIPCFTSLESPMCCGLGICYGCVVEYRGDDGAWDYRRTCVDGPVFDAYRLRWDE